MQKNSHEKGQFLFLFAYFPLSANFKKGTSEGKKEKKKLRRKESTARGLINRPRKEGRPSSSFRFSPFFRCGEQYGTGREGRGLFSSLLPPLLFIILKDVVSDSHQRRKRSRAGLPLTKGL